VSGVPPPRARPRRRSLLPRAARAHRRP
jgi:hypothetical protein